MRGRVDAGRLAAGGGTPHLVPRPGSALVRARGPVHGHLRLVLRHAARGPRRVRACAHGARKQQPAATTIRVSPRAAGLAAASADQFLSSASFGGGGLNRGRERPRLLFAKTILIYSRWEKLNAPTLHTALCAAGRRQARGHAGRGALRQASVAVVATPGSAMPEIVDKAPLGYNPPLDQRPDPWTINLRPRASMKPFRGAPW